MSSDLSCADGEGEERVGCSTTAIEFAKLRCKRVMNVRTGGYAETVVARDAHRYEPRRQIKECQRFGRLI